MRSSFPPTSQPARHTHNTFTFYDKLLVISQAITGVMLVTGLFYTRHLYNENNSLRTQNTNLWNSNSEAVKSSSKIQVERNVLRSEKEKLKQTNENLDNLNKAFLGTIEWLGRRNVRLHNKTTALTNKIFNLDTANKNLRKENELLLATTKAKNTGFNSISSSSSSSLSATPQTEALPAMHWKSQIHNFQQTS